MFKKLLVSSFLCLLPILGFAVMSKTECQGAAEDVAGAQAVLNEDLAFFKDRHKVIKATPAEEMGVSQEYKDFVISLVDKLKQGGDPQKAGMTAYQGCLAKLKAI